MKIAQPNPLKEKLMTERLLNTKEAAHYLGVKPQTIEKWRINDIRIPFVKIGKVVRYRKHELEAWVEKLMVMP